MQMDIIRDKHIIQHMLPLKPVQMTVEAETALPGSIRDETKVFYCWATADTESADWTGHQVKVQGQVNFGILFAQGDFKKIKYLETRAPYTHTINAEQENQDLQDAEVHTSIQVQNVSAKVMSGRVLLKSNVKICADVSFSESISAVADLKGMPGIEKKLIQTQSQRRISQGKSRNTIRDEIELSDLLQIQETLFASGYALIEDVKFAEHAKAHILGTIHLDAVHTSDMPGKPLIHTVHAIPYEQEIALAGEKDEMLACESAVKDVAVISLDHGESGEKIMRCEIDVESTAQLLREENSQFLLDAFTTEGENIQCEKSAIALHSACIHEDCAESGRISFSLPDGLPRMRQPLVAFANPVLTKLQPSGQKCIAHGVMDITMLYLTDDSQTPISVHVQEPFATTFAISLAAEDAAQLYATEVIPSAVTGDRCEIKFILRLKAHGVRKVTHSVVTDVALMKAEEVPQGISICFVQPNESLWDIARRYRMPQDSILKQNQELHEPLHHGDALVIYRK